MFDIRDLAYAQRRSHERILEFLKPAFDIHLIVPHSGKDTDTPPFFFCFRHEIIRDIVLSLITPEKKESIHLNLGIALHKRLSPGEVSDGLFKSLEHLHAAKVWEKSPELLKKIAEASYHASQRGAFISCHATAYVHAKLGLQYLGTCPWNREPNLGQQLFLLQAEAAYVLGYQDDLQKLTEHFLGDTNDVITAAPALEYQIFTLSREGQNCEVMSLISQVFSRIGLDIQDKKKWSIPSYLPYTPCMAHTCPHEHTASFQLSSRPPR